MGGGGRFVLDSWFTISLSSFGSSGGTSLSGLYAMCLIIKWLNNTLQVCLILIFNY
jgi:hypothetical protein